MNKLNDLITQLNGLRGQNVLFIDNNEVKRGTLKELHISISENINTLCHVQYDIIQDEITTSEVYRLHADSFFDDTEDAKIGITKILDNQIIKLQVARETLVKVV